MKTALLLVSLFALISCGNSSNSNSGKNGNEYRDCLGAISCLPSPYPWTVTSSSVNFPKNFSLRMINWDFQFDLPSCPQNGFFKVQRNAEGKTDIKFEFRLPKRSFKIEIIDLGENCDNNAVFHSEDNVVYGIGEISINGRVSGREVYVQLNN